MYAIVSTIVDPGGEGNGYFSALSSVTASLGSLIFGPVV